MKNFLKSSLINGKDFDAFLKSKTDKKFGKSWCECIMKGNQDLRNFLFQNCVFQMLCINIDSKCPFSDLFLKLPNSY